MSQRFPTGHSTVLSLPSWGLLFSLLLAACRPSVAPVQTAIASPPVTSPLTPAATPAPIASSSPTPPPASPQQIEFQGEPGVTVPGWFYPAARAGAPVIILMHGGGGQGKDWVTAGLVQWLTGQPVTGSLSSGVLVGGWRPLATSYNVLIFDNRGHWVQTGQAAIALVQKLPGVDGHRVATLGGSAGADGAVGACEAAGCVGVLALSPTGSVYGETFAAVEARLAAQGKAVWCVATEGDGGCPRGTGPAYQIWVYAGLAHGLGMLGVRGVEDVVREFLQTVVSGLP